MTNSEIKIKAKETLNGKWLNPILVCLIYGLFTGGLTLATVYILEPNQLEQNLIQIVLSLLFAPLLLGFINYLMNFIKGKDLPITTIFRGYNQCSKAVVLNLLMQIYVALWTLVFIVPGIIKSYSYSMSFYILNDNPELTPSQALDMSDKLMEGHKMDLFCLYISFIGLVLLSVLTLGIGLIWLIPYMEVSKCYFYENIKALNIINSKELM